MVHCDLLAALLLAGWASSVASQAGASPPVELALSNLFKTSGTPECSGRAGLRAARNLLRGVHRTPLSADGYQQFAKLRQEVFCRDAQPLHMTPSGDQTLLDPTLNITMIKIHPMPVYITVYGREHDIISGALLDGHQWEAKDMAELLWAMKAPLPVNAASTSSISPGLLVDVGANVGSFTFNMAAMGYEVISFEGMETNQRLMRNSLCASARPIMSRVTLHAFGLGAARMTCYLLAEGINRGSGIPICGAHNETHAEVMNNNPAYKVQSAMEIERLDDVMQRDIKAMKIDVEGFEPMVLAGAARLLQEHTVWFIYVEFKKPLLESSLRGTQEKPIDFVKQLDRMGYKISQQSFRGPFMRKGDIEQLNQLERTPLYFVHHKYETD